MGPSTTQTSLSSGVRTSNLTIGWEWATSNRTGYHVQSGPPAVPPAFPTQSCAALLAGAALFTLQSLWEHFDNLFTAFYLTLNWRPTFIFTKISFKFGLPLKSREFWLALKKMFQSQGNISSSKNRLSSPACLWQGLAYWVGSCKSV